MSWITKEDINNIFIRCSSWLVDIVIFSNSKLRTQIFEMCYSGYRLYTKTISNLHLLSDSRSNIQETNRRKSKVPILEKVRVDGDFNCCSPSSVKLMNQNSIQLTRSITENQGSDAGNQKLSCMHGSC